MECMVNALRNLWGKARDWAYTLPAPPIIRSFVELIVRVFRSFFRDDGSHMAAGVAYYAIFSMFPLALATISIAGLFIKSDDVREQVLSFLQRQVGIGSEELVTSNIDALVNARGAIGVVAAITLFWASRAVFGAVHRVLNRAWKVREPRHLFFRQLLQVTAALAIAIIFIASATVGPTIRALASRNETLFGVGLPWVTAFTVLPFVISASVFMVIYKVVPDTRVRWRDALLAAVVASVLFEAAKFAFTYYLGNLSSLDLVYGSVTTVVVLMLFLYIVALILVLGAEVSSEYQRSSTAGLLILRGHWRPVVGGFAPLSRRRLIHAVVPEGVELPSTEVDFTDSTLVHPEGIDLPRPDRNHEGHPV
jgi:membrane protein